MAAQLHCAKVLPVNPVVGDLYYSQKLNRLFVGVIGGKFMPFEDFIREVPPLIEGPPHLAQRLQRRITQLETELAEAKRNG
jgi:hypothetical protein